MLYIARGNFWTTSGQTIITVISLTLLIAFANLIPKETYGAYRYLLSIVGILTLFSLTGMNSAVTRSVATGAVGILRKTVLYQVRWNLLMSVSLLACSGYYYAKGNETFAFATLIFALTVPFTLAFNTYGPYLVGRKMFFHANLFGVISTILYACVTFLVLWYSDSLILVVAAYAITGLVTSYVLYRYVLQRHHPSDTGEYPNDTIEYAKKLTYIRWLAPIASHIDKIILAQFWGAAEVAVYTLANTIPSKGVPALKNLMDIGLPKFSQKTPEQINNVMVLRLIQGFGVGAAATIAYVITAPLLFTYILPQYLDGLHYSQLLAITFIFALPNRYMGLLFESQKMSRQLFANSIANSVIAIALFVIMGIIGGVMGLVIARVLHASVGFFVNLVSWMVSTRKKRD